MSEDVRVAPGVDEKRGGEKLGPGLLVLVVGPSGAGKDTLLAYARDRLVGRADISFARRRITRPTDATEDHVSVDAAAFAQGLAQGRFPLHWQANGLSYALGEEVAQDISAGRIVVANGSRAAVGEARARFARVKLVHVTAPTEILAARIAARGRESAEDVLARLKREPPLDAPPDLTVLNVGAVETAGEALAGFLRGLT
ncbi:phosphonate metabolism protein/1,5-bisphosphokinase (PRPP-forming) PhnN [Ancylobacter vacuolatus]|uniref:Ribose 1,5-bisphosphate phosphokinase PhnN n=1 Tax=Ancylobacter vacuolatus TaxID=223389 RepID=A0ABU0DIW9_9HYPH|nr:phosphonate metabolism protein/1,5-bisphosphokinase (PRPP-forming) PhnN [Ancylobacter vacuolatus]MDQ0348266.1 ribose 1,5-bisphosphokinase [Ancylobacter vacuolatus]